jgi:acyl-CoA thioester hydrolase
LLIQKTGFDIHEAKSIGLVVDSACSFLQELSFPEIIQVGVAIGKIGTTSLRYELAIFKQAQDQASAQGHFVHVFVDRETRKTVPISESVRETLKSYLL